MLCSSFTHLRVLFDLLEYLKSLSSLDCLLVRFTTFRCRSHVQRLYSSSFSNKTPCLFYRQKSRNFSSRIAVFNGIVKLLKDLIKYYIQVCVGTCNIPRLSSRQVQCFYHP